MHARNRFRDGYDFQQLVAASPLLAPFVKLNAYGDVSIDYAVLAAVAALNRALFTSAYGADELGCAARLFVSPVPGRSDYLHHLADPLAGRDPSAIPRGPSVATRHRCRRQLRLSPSLAQAATAGASSARTSSVACEWARKLAKANTAVADLIECRLQPSPTDCFNGVVVPGERFTASMCNPRRSTYRPRTRPPQPDAAAESRWPPASGGAHVKLWWVGGRTLCDGGELGFRAADDHQSSAVPDRCRWFTTLVSKSGIPASSLRGAATRKLADVKTIGMGQGQKQSRILAWTFI